MVLAFEPVLAQKFTKKEQARREARAKNYFYGNSFSIQAGYTHAWLRRNTIPSSSEFGFSTVYQNTRPAFNIGMTWDRSVNKWWGTGLGMFYTGLGGQKCTYYNSGLAGTSSQLRSDRTEDLNYGAISVHGLFRAYCPITYFSRISLDLGLHVSKNVNAGDDISSFDYGPVAGVSYEWKHLSVRVLYIPGVNTNLMSGAETAQNSLWFNVGYRLWKK